MAGSDRRRRHRASTREPGLKGTFPREPKLYRELDRLVAEPNIYAVRWTWTPAHRTRAEREGSGVGSAGGERMVRARHHQAARRAGFHAARLCGFETDQDGRVAVKVRTLVAHV